MKNYNLDADLLDTLDILNFTLSSDFVEKWRYKYSTNFLILFQKKLLESLERSKPMKRKVLYSFLTVKYKYSPDLVDDFFKSIDIELYSPIIK